jgi:hypothetical protein
VVLKITSVLSTFTSIISTHAHSREQAEWNFYMTNVLSTETSVVVFTRMSLILTCMCVISTRKILFQHARVWILYAELWFSHRQAILRPNVISICSSVYTISKSAIITRRLWFTMYECDIPTQSAIYTRRVWFQHSWIWFRHAQVWFRYTLVLFQHVACVFKTKQLLARFCSSYRPNPNLI